MPPVTDSKGALGQLQQYSSSMQDPTAAYKSAAGQFGVDQAGQNVMGLRQAINNTTTLLNNVAPSVMGRTGQSLVTNAQATRQIGNEQAPIQSQLDQQNTAYQGASQDYNTAEGRAEALAGNTLSQQNNQRSYLQSLYDSLAGQEKDSASLAEQKRQFDASLADTQSARAGSGTGGIAGLGLSNASSTSTPATATPQDHLTADIKSLITPDYATRFNPGYTEREIQRLQQAYPEIAPNEIANAVYQYRKQVAGN